MKKEIILISMLLVLAVFSQRVFAYPPAVGILGKAKDCLSCHVNNGPWKDDKNLIIEIRDKETRKSLKQPDGSFIIEVKRGEIKTVLTVIGRTKGDKGGAPKQNAWLYVDPKTIVTNSLSKFAPGWEVNLPMSCRMVGDKLDGFEDAKVTVLPMTVRPTAAAQDSELILQVMLKEGEPVKGKPEEGLIGNYFERRVKLRVTD